MPERCASISVRPSDEVETRAPRPRRPSLRPRGEEILRRRTGPSSLPTNLGLALILIYVVLTFPFDPETRLLLLPVEPTQILWINLVAAVALALPIAFEAKESDVMRRPPRDPKAPVLSGFVLWRTAVAAILITAGAVGVFLWELGRYLDLGAAPPQALAEAQTLAATTVIVFQI